jgi:hypothetical protein
VTYGRGELVLSRVYRPSISDGPAFDEIFISQADPTAWMDDMFFRQILDGNMHPAFDIIDDCLVIKAANRTVVYKISTYNPENNCWSIYWPD